jgi:hypothetical protein
MQFGLKYQFWSRSVADSVHGKEQAARGSERTKEQIGGFFVIDVPDQWHARTPHRGVTDTITGMDVRMASPDVAVATVASELSSFTTPDGVRHESERQIRTFVVVKRGPRWLIMQDHNTFVAAQLWINRGERIRKYWAAPAEGGKEMTGGALGLVGLVVVMLLFRLVGSAFKEKHDRHD